MGGCSKEHTLKFIYLETVAKPVDLVGSTTIKRNKAVRDVFTAYDNILLENRWLQGDQQIWPEASKHIPQEDMISVIQKSSFNVVLNYLLIKSSG